VDSKNTRERWGIVLAWWLDHPAVDPSALAVLAALATYADPTGLCWPHPKTLAEKLKRSRPWVLEVLNRLVAAGLIEKRPRRSRARPGAWEFILVNFGSSRSTALSSVACQAADSFCQQTGSKQEQKNSEYSLKVAESPFSHPDGQEQSEVAVSTWMPTTEDMAFAAAKRPDLTPSDIALMTQKMLAQHCGQPLTNISGTWRRWLLNERTTNARQNQETRRPSYDGRHTHTGFRSSSNDRASRNDATAQLALARLVARHSNDVPEPAGCA
jgi:hypothetical protein